MKNKKQTKFTFLRTEENQEDMLKPHKCPVCKRAFRYRHKLTVHYRIHTGKTPVFKERAFSSELHKLFLFMRIIFQVFSLTGTYKLS